MKKILILTLALLMLLGTLAACNTPSPDLPEEQTTTQDTESTQQTTTQDTENTPPTTDEVTTQPEPEQELEIRPATPPECAQTPEQIVENLTADLTVMQTGSRTKEVILPLQEADNVAEAFTLAGYAVAKPFALEGAKFENIIFYSTECTVTLQKTANSAYLFWEPYSADALDLLFTNNATNTGEVIAAQIGVEREEETDNPMIGMCYVYKLSDGSAVIIDGGVNTKACRNNILATLQRMDIAKDDAGRYRITAWVLTHGHSDHRGAIVGFGKNYGDQVSLSYLVYNFPLGELSTSTWDLLAFEEKMAKFYPDAQYVAPHAGLQYHFDNLTVQVLYSPELIYSPDQPVEYYNNTSLIFIADCAGARILHMGDAGELASTATWELYEKSAFGANVLQITHHGLYTGPDSHKWKNLKNIYSASQATLGLLPMGSRKPGDSRNGRHTVLIGWGGANYQVSFVINKRDNHGQSSISQEYYEQFVAQVAAGTAQHQTLFGYDGINTVTNDDGMITYLSCNETTPMVTLITLSAQGASIAHNQMLYDWFADTATAD